MLPTALTWAIMCAASSCTERSLWGKGAAAVHHCERL